MIVTVLVQYWKGMENKYITKKQSKNFNKNSNHPLQSWQWGEFRKAWGNEVLFTKHGIITFHQIPLTPYKLGMFIRGPKPTKKMLLDLKKIARENKLIFIKLEPNFSISTNHQSPITNHSEKVEKLLRKNGCVSGKTLFTPTTFWIDLTKSEDELMKSFNSKTRYNIRLAKRKGVEIVENNSDEAFNKYIELTRKTVERQKFYAHSEKYHRLMWKVLHTDMVAKKQKPIAHLLSATYKKEIITTWIVFVWKDFLYYPYGASSDKYKNLMANNLMMWEAIRYGKKLDLKTFDLWGRELGKGFTKFKEGYSPNIVEFLGTWDLVTSSLYYPYLVLEKIRWLFLRLRTRLVVTRPTF